MIIQENKNKKVVVIAVICVVIIIVAVLGSWLIRKKLNPFAGIFSNKQNQQENQKPSLNNPIPSSYEKKSRTIITADEMAQIKGKNQQEITDYFNMERDKCKARYKGIQQLDPVAVMQQSPDMFRIDPFETEKFITCSAIKDNKIEYCQKIPDSLIGDQCVYRFKLFKNSIFPALRSGQCTSEYIQVCKDSGEVDCDNLCNALATAKTEQDCANMQKGSLAHSICLAVNKKDYTACDDQTNKMRPSPNDPTVGEDLWLECVQMSHLARAARENNPEILGEIARRDQYPIDKLYFDQNFDCRSILDISEVKCDLYYDNNRLNLLLDAAGAKAK